MTSTLTPSQLAAIEHTKGHLQLIACAGAGKTEVVARHVAHLLKSEKKPDPKSIIAFTFTDKAAAELKERILLRCREELGNIEGLAEMYVGTIHGWCLDLLKTEIPKYLKFEVLNEVQQALFVERNSAKSGLTTTTDLKGQKLKRYLDTDRYLEALAILREGHRDDSVLKGSSIMKGLETYQKLLDANAYLDYSAIMHEAVRVMASDKALQKRLAARVRHVIVDEYQDVNPIQECVVRIFAKLGSRIVVVGDDDQTLYQWRGSEIENILNFEKNYSKVTSIRLEENFRSSRGIVETAREFIRENTERLPKEMKPTGAQKDEPGDIVALGFPDPDAEAAYIVETIKDLRGVAFIENGETRGLTWSDCAILLRSVRRNGEPIIRALKQAGIPFVVSGLDGLFTAPEADAARALFFFMVGEVDDATLESAWQAAQLGVPAKQLKAAIAAAGKVREELGTKDEKRFNVYSIQRQFQNFLTTIGLREELVPDGRGEVVFFNLGRFSQLISDFETIHYKSKPDEKYRSFADFLKYRGEGYPEGSQEETLAAPDAVQVITIHQAKGRQWPAVFVPALLKNRFPAKKTSGRTVWHILPEDGIHGAARYRGGTEDERRLFYVAITRSQKFLFMTWAPVPGNQLYQKVSDFFEFVLRSKYVKRMAVSFSGRKRAEPKPRDGRLRLTLSFSDLKYFFLCPYQFKLRVLYGFNAPIHEALGYGKSLHDCLAEAHTRALRGDRPIEKDAPDLVKTHLHAPYAYPALLENLKKSAEKVVRDYLHDNQELFDKLEFAEKAIEIDLGDQLTVVGRIDLVRRIDTGEITIVDLKTRERSQAEELTEAQLDTYALGYRELTGRDADFLEVYDLEERKKKPRSVDADLIEEVKSEIRAAADAIRANRFKAKPHARVCGDCDYVGICSHCYTGGKNQ